MSIITRPIEPDGISPGGPPTESPGIGPPVIEGRCGNEIGGPILEGRRGRRKE